MAGATSSQDADPNACVAYLASLWPRAQIQLLEHQGGCSVTVLIMSEGLEGPSDIVQLRPMRFAVDPEIGRAARLAYGQLAPSIQGLGEVDIEMVQLQILHMAILQGKSFSEVQPKSSWLNVAAEMNAKRLLHGLAQAHADAWHSANVQDVCSGRVGRSLRGRLSRLSKELPSIRLREIACSILSRVNAHELASLPVVLTHGDMIPSNLLVQPETWQLQGLVDWAEAEYLPFGMSLYSVDYVLGHLKDDQDAGHGYVRYKQAQFLTLIFWQRLLMLIPSLEDPAMLRAVRLARDVGVLLRHGFAWDDGRIDRVVNPTDDVVELTYLESFLPKPLVVRPEPAVKPCVEKQILTTSILV